MPQSFDTFMSQLKETNFRLCDYTDFDKVIANTKMVEMKLNSLNYLIGKENLDEAIEDLWKENSSAFSVLDILLAVRKKDKKIAVNSNNEAVLIENYLVSLEGVKTFIHETGLADVFKNKNVKNLVDYVFGVEVGLDTNARKNRGGELMSGLVSDQIRKRNIPFDAEVSCFRFPEIVGEFGADKKVFDFVIKTKIKTYLIEVNFYTGGGSKLNEVARSYSEIAPLINKHQGYEFVWITDGIGWHSARSKLEQAYRIIPSIFNLTTLNDFLDKVKTEL